jgi:hypothetical protein
MKKDEKEGLPGRHKEVIQVPFHQFKSLITRSVPNNKKTRLVDGYLCLIVPQIEAYLHFSF